MRAVVEVFPFDVFALWPAERVTEYGWRRLAGGLPRARVGTILKRIAECNDQDPDGDRPPRPGEPVASLLHGLLTYESPYAQGGLLVEDSATGVVFAPGCCSGIDEWRGWCDVLDGRGDAFFGHDPDARVSLDGDVVRLTLDAEAADSPVIDVPVAELGALLAGVERDLADFSAQAGRWTKDHLPAHAPRVNAALARLLDV
ncbi:hypothetical protein CNX65_14995 [Actinosynnema pretiosum]|uniref:Uncharacterized protein n=2 Tax=Actinosynnema pretiosum TaxID=42197 RepID=A0A290ZGQ6_9PSEU|nr:hypothetical protein [Actinosynnema pretiosum]ATE58181.1 hypothetical protein CNX65_14995 [Actinosynnema pretiosum]